MDLPDINWSHFTRRVLTLLGLEMARPSLKERSSEKRGPFFSVFFKMERGVTGGVGGTGGRARVGCSLKAYEEDEEEDDETGSGGAGGAGGAGSG